MYESPVWPVTGYYTQIAQDWEILKSFFENHNIKQNWISLDAILMVDPTSNATLSYRKIFFEPCVFYDKHQMPNTENMFLNLCRSVRYLNHLQIPVAKNIFYSDIQDISKGRFDEKTGQWTGAIGKVCWNSKNSQNLLVL